MQNNPIGAEITENLTHTPQIILVHTPDKPEYPYINYLQRTSPTSGENSQKKSKAPNVNNLTISEQFIDQLPTKPSKRNPHQRSNPPFRRKTTEKTVIYLTATSLLERNKKEIDRSNREAMTCHKIRHNSDCAIQRRQSQMQTTRIFHEPLELFDFRPLLAPFVPDLLRLLVNSVEKHCYHHGWSLVFEQLPSYYQPGRMALIRLVDVWSDQRAMQKIIKRLPIPVKIVTIRLFLDQLAIKPLLLKRTHVNELAKVPLFDFFLRPHSLVRSVIQRSIMASSAVHVDTMAFMMIHLIHAWEYAPNPVEGKLRLAAIYGKLLISFSEKPELRGTDNGDVKTIESALIEVVLEICDYHFWNHLTSLKIRAAFKNVTDMERFQVKSEENQKRESVRQFLLPTVEGGLPDLYSDMDSGFEFDSLPNLHSLCQQISTIDEKSSTKLSSEDSSSEPQSRSQSPAGREADKK